MLHLGLSPDSLRPNHRDMQKYTILTVEYDFYALCALIVMLLLPVVLTCIAEVWTKVRRMGMRRGREGSHQRAGEGLASLTCIFPPPTPRFAQGVNPVGRESDAFPSSALLVPCCPMCVEWDTLIDLILLLWQERLQDDEQGGQQGEAAAGAKTSSGRPDTKRKEE